MKLLVTTQKVDIDDDILGFFHSWLIEFAKRAEKVTVICLEKGEHNLPENVEVLSLGKEAGRSRIKYVLKFYHYLWGVRNDYDSVFVHMNPIYVVLAGLLWRLTGKRIGLWYVHRQKDWKLFVAEKFVHHIFTAAPKSLSIESKKTKVVGHGIDLTMFPCMRKREGNTLRVLHMGRISKIKDSETFVRTIKILKEKVDRPVEGVFAGGPETSRDKKYLEEIKKLVGDLDLQKNIVFAGSLKFSDVPKFFSNADIVLNLTPAGGVDKAALSALATCRPLIVSNESFEEIFKDYSSRLIARHGYPEDFANKALALLDSPDLEELKNVLRKRIEEGYTIETLIKRIGLLLWQKT